MPLLQKLYQGFHHKGQKQGYGKGQYHRCGYFKHRPGQYQGNEGHEKEIRPPELKIVELIFHL
jgi:hypothetical protein